MNKNEESIVAISDMAYSSLWFLSTCMSVANVVPPRTINQVYAETIGTTGLTLPIMNAGTAILGAYALLVLPHGVQSNEFSRAISGIQKLDWTGFNWDDPRTYGPNLQETKLSGQKSEHNVLGGIRNALAHSNFEVTPHPTDTKAVTIRMWSQRTETSPPIRHVSVSAHDLVNFVMRFHQLFLDWHTNGKKF